MTLLTDTTTQLDSYPSSCHYLFLHRHPWLNSATDFQHKCYKLLLLVKPKAVKHTTRRAGQQWHPFKWALLETPEAISCTTALEELPFPHVVSHILLKGSNRTSRHTAYYCWKWLCAVPTVLIICWNRELHSYCLDRHWWMVHTGGRLLWFSISSVCRVATWNRLSTAEKKWTKANKEKMTYPEALTFCWDKSRRSWSQWLHPCS